VGNKKLRIKEEGRRIKDLEQGEERSNLSVGSRQQAMRTIVNLLGGKIKTLIARDHYLFGLNLFYEKTKVRPTTSVSFGL